jgi:hypothetical protein
LAVCQYDATWRSDGGHTAQHVNRGYTLFIPKFMKAQRVYAPTPLANFQRLSFQLLDPENQPLSLCPDSSKIQRIVWGNDVSGSGCGVDTSGEYLFLQTTDWFPVDAYSRLDRILLDGLTFTSNTSATETAGKRAIEWLQRPEGHIVIGTAWSASDDTSGAPILGDGPMNSCNYANLIIIRNRFQDPTTGACELDYFTGSSVGDAALAAEFRDYPYQAGAVLNLSRQVQLTLRVITREYDGATNLRPDNV